jgi:beta-glucosidase
LGDYTSRVILQNVTTVLGGLRERFGESVKIAYAKGCGILDEDRSGFVEAAKIARASDLAIVVLGESEWLAPEGGTNGEARDAATLELTGAQEDLLKAVHETGTPVLLVLINGRPLAIRWAAAHVPAIVEAWLPGEAGGRAVAEVIAGDYNPSGRLPVTFPRHAGQLPLYYNSRPTRAVPGKDKVTWREYVDLPGSPLYPFGYGLSYTRFEYGGLRVAPPEIRTGGEVKITAEIANAGDRAGEEVVQLYVRDVISSVTRPVKELRGFQKIALQQAAKATVEFTLTPDDLALLDKNLERVVEPGTFEVMIGASSEDIRLKGSFEVR